MMSPMRTVGDALIHRMEPAKNMASNMTQRIPYTIARRDEMRDKHRNRRRLLAVGTGVLLEYFLDPRMGRTRRTKVASRLGGLTRSAGRRTERLSRRSSATVHGLKQRMTHLREVPKEFDDATLQQKVQSEVLRGGPDSPKQSISIDVSNGIVTLRGACKGTDARALERAIRRTHGVHGVVNLLHEPGTPAPNKASALRASG